MIPFEKLGLLYLGRPHDPASRVTSTDPLLYDSRDLVTHGVCVGMTGSGKTGLCIALIEEAAIDGIPVIAIDPKGDLGNLLLTFPRLAPEDFRPWIDEDEARRAGKSADSYAAEQAELWKNGLAEWGQDGTRIERLRGAADFAIYTPGSRAGLPVSILRSFAAPPEALRSDGEALAERASATATSLLDLAGATSDLRSREHTLVSAILATAWRAGRDLDIAAVIQQIQQPPFERIGVAALGSFFPEGERFALAMQLNSLLAAPGFEAWLEGEPLDPATLLYTADAKPRVAIFSIAHLADAERMFFVSLLLNQIVSWMRGQPGTSSLRALVYMDEIAGYFPPVANPPSKPPLLTLLKQGRAYGVGVLLATQNPVDLDYKGLSNAGTWFLGRLQTERDKARVLDGLEGVASGSLGRDAADGILAALGKRQFLLHNVHAAAPVVFHTRWALSYLRGPLTREQIRKLMQGRAPAAAPTRPGAVPGPAEETAANARPAGAPRPVVPPSIDQYLVPGEGAQSASEPLTAVALGAARVHYTDAKLGLDVFHDVLYAAPVTDAAVPLDWSQGTKLEIPASALQPLSSSEPPLSFSELPPAAAQPKNYTAWTKALSRWIGQAERLDVLRHPMLKIVSRPGESERDFRIRLQHEGRAARDAALDAVQRKYAGRQAALAERIRRAEAAVGREQEQATQQKTQTALSFGATVIGALLGRKAVSSGTLGRATTAARGVGRSMKEASDVKRAAEALEALRKQTRDLEDQVAADMAAIGAQYDVDVPLERVRVAPKRGQVEVRFVALGWIAPAALERARTL